MTRQQNNDAPPGMPVDPPAPITPGAMVGDGRYRLLEQAGGDERIGATFWRARDLVLERDVGLTTLVGPGGARSVRTALAAGRLEHPAIARILDVLSDPRQAGRGLAGLIVTEWIVGADLGTLATDTAKAGRTLPAGAVARALSPLASAVDAAHRAGLALGIDHPQKIRIGNDGLAKVAFPVASTTGQQPDDLRGLGAAIYLLLTGRWPLPDPPAGLTPAQSTPGDVAQPAQSLHPEASPTLATLAQRCLAGASADGVHSGAAVHKMLEQVTNAEAETMLLTPMPAGGPPDGWAGQPPTAEGGDAQRAKRRKLAIAMAVLGVAVLVLFGWVASQVMSFFSDGNAAGGPTVVVSGPSTAGSGQSSRPNGSGGPNNPATPPAAGPIQAAGIEVFDVTGDPDNPNRASRAIDGNPGSAWKTYDYNQPFPALKPGVGLLVSFSEPVALATVQVDSPSAGSTVEVRTAPAGDVGLAGTTVLGTATLTEGRTQLPLTQSAPGQRVLIWITGLASRDGKNATELAELTFLRAG